MNLNYRVEEAFDKLENAIVYAELHDSISTAEMDRYARLFDDAVNLRKNAQKGHDRSRADRKMKPICSIEGEVGSETDVEIHIHCDSNEERKCIAENIMKAIDAIATVYRFSKSSAQQEER